MHRFSNAWWIACTVGVLAAGCDDGSSGPSPFDPNGGSPTSSTGPSTTGGDGGVLQPTTTLGSDGGTHGTLQQLDGGTTVDPGASTGDAAAGGGDGAVAQPASLTSIMRGDDPTEASATAKGPYNVESYTDGFTVTNYGGGTIWYPSDAEAPFGAVAICPGWTAPQSSIAGWGPFLASHGIVALTMDTANTLDSVDQRVDELMDALASIKGENDRSGSPLQGKIDTMRLGVMGWSMGGGGSWLAADMHPELRTAVTFAGHIATATNKDVSMIQVPTLMFAGSTDTAVLGGGMSQPVYDQIPDSTPKMLWEVEGAGHSVANDPSGTGGAIGRYGLSWEKVFLEGDERYRQFLLEMPPMASDFETNLK